MMYSSDDEDELLYLPVVVDKDLEFIQIWQQRKII